MKILFSLLILLFANQQDKVYIRNDYPVSTSITLKPDSTFVKVIITHRGWMANKVGKYKIDQDTLELSVLKTEYCLETIDTIYKEYYLYNDSTLLEIHELPKDTILRNILKEITPSIPPFKRMNVNN